VSRGPWSPRRLTAVVTLVAAIAAGALAIGLFLLVRDARLRDSLERARTEAIFDLRLSSSLLETGDLQQAVETYEEERRVDAVLISGDRRFDSDPSLDLPLGGDLRRIVADGQLGYERVEVDGVPSLIVGGPTPDREAELYFLFSEARIEADLTQLRAALVGGWLAIVAIAFAFARGAAARIRTLAAAEAWSRRFTSDVSHELRTPVAALVSEAEALREHLDRLPVEVRRPAELLVADVARLRRLVEDLTDLAAIDAGRDEIRMEAVELGSLVRSTVRTRGWDPHVSVEADPVELHSDRSKVDRIVANLVGNALQHGGRDVSIRVARDGQDAVVEVRDAGPGIAPEHAERVFERFHRVDPARSGPGSGLGLAIAREHARLLGGDVFLRSEPGRGSTFSLRLPATVAEPLRARGSRVTAGPEDGKRPEHEGGIR
jgi:signal transduction histidine kinase